MYPFFCQNKFVNTEEGGGNDDVVNGHVHKNLFDHWKRKVIP